MMLIRFGSSTLLDDMATRPVYEWARENERPGWGVFSRRGRRGRITRPFRAPVIVDARRLALRADIRASSASLSLARVISPSHRIIAASRITYRDRSPAINTRR
jgi:hypothetical protein